MLSIFDSVLYVPHGYCLSWEPWLVVLFAFSDLVIFAAYSMIPIALMMFLRRRPDIRFRGLVSLFAAFIMLCGITHLLSILTLWVPVYPLHGFVKFATGTVSAVTAVVLFALIPRLVAIPSPRQLEEANSQLQEEIASHEATFAKLREAQHTLEAKVVQRTAELTEANKRLSIMAREAVHRGRNLLSVVSSLARQTAKGAEDIAGFMERFIGRIDALSSATATVATGAATASASLEDVVRRQLEPVTATFGERVGIEGPAVEVGTEAAQQFGLALHELATNAVKYGALAAADGTVRVAWTLADGGETLRLEWSESGAAAPDQPDGAAGGGFGTTLITRVVPAMLHGAAERTFTGQGLRYVLSAPLARISPQIGDAAEEEDADAIWAGGLAERGSPYPA